MTQKITPFLWFDTRTEEALNHYTSAFKNSRIISIKRYPDGPLDGPMKGMEGKVLTAVFELEGQRFMALDGGPIFKFTPAISQFVNCETEAEIDQLWEVLTDGGMAMMPLQEYPFSPKFGWAMDKYGVSWQLSLVPRQQKIVPFLMFVNEQHGKAEEAIELYTSLFENSGIVNIDRFTESDENEVVGTIKHGIFTLNGQEFMVLDSNYAHEFAFTEATSFYVECENQEEVDHFWNALSSDPASEQCGWCKDRFGISWQIVPTVLPKLLNDPDPEKSKRVMNAMLQMKKLDIAALNKAYEE